MIGDGVIERPVSVGEEVFTRCISVSNLENTDLNRPRHEDKGSMLDTNTKTNTNIRSISVEALLAFTFDHKCWDYPTWKVLRDIVKPATLITPTSEAADSHSAHSCSFVELEEMREYTQEIESGSGCIYICHCYGAAWGDIVFAAAHGSYSINRHVYIDVLCMNQHIGIGEVFAFRSTIPKCAAMIVAMSPLPSLNDYIASETERNQFANSVQGHHAKLTNPFFRLSCLVEIAQAVASCTPVVVKCGSAICTPDPRPFAKAVCVHFDARKSCILQNLMSGMIDCESAWCHSPIVRQHLIDAVEKLTGDGYAWIEAAVEGEIVSAISSMEYSFLEVDAAVCGEREALEAIDVPAGSTGKRRERAGNILLAVCAGNRVQLLESLLKKWTNSPENVNWLSALINDSLVVWSASNSGHCQILELLLGVPGVKGNETIHAGKCV